MSEALVAAIASSALAIAILALALVVGALSRLNRLELAGPRLPTFGLEIGDEAPGDVIEEQLDGQGRVILGGSSLWLFASSTCQACQELIANLNKDAAQVSRSNLLLVAPTQADVDSLKADADFDANWVVDADGRLRSGFGALATPMAFLLRDGRVAERELGPEIGRLLSAADDAAAGIPR